MKVCKSPSGCSNQLMESLKFKADFLRYGKGQLVYCEGSTPLGVYIVQRGTVKLSKLGSDGKVQIMRFAIKDELLGYSDVMSNEKYSLSARTLEDSEFLFVPKQDFIATISDENGFCKDFLALLSKDLKQAEEMIADLAYKPVRSRVANALLFLSGKLNNGGNGSVEFALCRSDLASFVGTAKETVNRLLSEFRNENLITTEGKAIKILKPEKLDRLGSI